MKGKGREGDTDAYTEHGDKNGWDRKGKLTPTSRMNRAIKRG